VIASSVKGSSYYFSFAVCTVRITATRNDQDEWMRVAVFVKIGVNAGLKSERMRITIFSFLPQINP